MYFWLLLLTSATTSAQEGPTPEPKPTDDWIYLENADLRVGLLRSHGGAIGHLSAPKSDFNALNHYDHGRLVQQSYYGDADDSQWVEKQWCYNPVQGGDYLGKAAEVVVFKTTEASAYVKTTPRHWASGKLLTECTMEQWLELDGAVLRVRYQFTYNGDMEHKGRHQETPAVFVAPELSNLVTYTGDKPWTSAPLQRRIPGWPNEAVTLSEGWAAYVDEKGLGVGVYVPGTTEATCYRFQGGAGSDCSYIAPLHHFALTPKLSFSYTAFFTLGDVDTIRKRFELLPRHQP
ncbi:MAG: hypothetical protein JNL67_19570 [Planctomycetaceae bacterium]|nr:hypothetical protein [Planctomycetaceae bacterium]